MMYQEQPSRLIGSRYKSTCALVKNKNGDRLVVIIGGGNSAGMEVWNPMDGTINILSKKIPSEVGKFSGLVSSQVISVNGGKELILYGGFVSGTYKGGIWRYSVEANSWTKLGAMLKRRYEHVVLPVIGIECQSN